MKRCLRRCSSSSLTKRLKDFSSTSPSSPSSCMVLSWPVMVSSARSSAALRSSGGRRDVVVVDGAGGGEALVLLAGPAVVEDGLGEPGVGVFLQHAGEEAERGIGGRGGRLGAVGLEGFHHRRGVVDGEAGGGDQDRQRREAREALQLVLGFLRARRPVERDALVFQERPHLGRIGRGFGAEQAIGHLRLRKAGGNYAGRRSGDNRCLSARDAAFSLINAGLPGRDAAGGDHRVRRASLRGGRHSTKIGRRVGITGCAPMG